MSVWDEARMGGRLGKRHSLGLWDPRYKLASLAWLPPLSQRKKVYGKRRYLYVFNLAVLANQPTAFDRLSVTQDFWWTDTTFSPQTAGAINALSLYDTKNQVRYSNIAELDLNFGSIGGLLLQSGGSGTVPCNLPIFERRITLIPAGATLLMTLQVSTPLGASGGIVPGTEQVCLGGYTE